MLLGYTGSTNQVRKFELDLDLDESSGTVMKEAVFLNFSRLITKDQIKKGTFSITLGTASWNADGAAPFELVKTLTDSSSTDTAGTNNTLGGDYGLLKENGSGVARGLVFYQAGIAILSTSSWASIGGYGCWNDSIIRRRINWCIDTIDNRGCDWSIYNHWYSMGTY